MFSFSLPCTDWVEICWEWLQGLCAIRLLGLFASELSANSSAVYSATTPSIIYPGVLGQLPKVRAHASAVESHLCSFCPKGEGQANIKKWYPSYTCSTSSDCTSCPMYDCIVDESIGNVDEAHVDRRTGKLTQMSVQGRLKENIQFSEQFSVEYDVRAN